MTNIGSIKKPMNRKALEALVLREAAGEWGCEDMTGVTIVPCDPAIFDRNWTVTNLQNEDLPAGKRTVQRIVERLGQQYELQGD